METRRELEPRPPDERREDAARDGVAQRASRDRSTSGGSGRGASPGGDGREAAARAGVAQRASGAGSTGGRVDADRSGVESPRAAAPARGSAGDDRAREGALSQGSPGLGEAAGRGGT